MKILITGTSSGLGFFLHQKLDAERFLRVDENHKITKKYYDIVIHTAFNKKVDIKKKVKESQSEVIPEKSKETKK